MRLAFRKIVMCIAVTSTAAMMGCSGIVNLEAAKKLGASVGQASFTVYPSFIRSNKAAYDAQSAADLVKFIENQRFGKAQLNDQQVPITGKWRHNQARMLRESASDFAAYVKSHPPTTDYAVLAECLIGSKEVIGAHVYVLDAKGEVADAVLANSHHAEFASRSPKTVADCHAVMQDILRKQWNQAKEKGADSDSTNKG
jgi:hypothetical protein